VEGKCAPAISFRFPPVSSAAISVKRMRSATVVKGISPLDPHMTIPSSAESFHILRFIRHDSVSREPSAKNGVGTGAKMPDNFNLYAPFLFDRVYHLLKQWYNLPEGF
jgi:hypothetical protein